MSARHTGATASWSGHQGPKREAANGDEARILLQKQDLQIDVLTLAFVTDTYATLAMGYRFAAHFYERDAACPAWQHLPE
jgi:hypothetical protein